MSSLSTLPKGDSAWLLRKSIQRIMQQVSVLETNIGSSTTGNSSNGQVIFNDNGTLRGDADMTFNTALNRLIVSSLEVSTTATITGDLTVDTNTLKVDSANNRVGIGTASPTAALQVNLAEVSSAAGTSAIISNTTGGGNRIAALRLQNLTNQWNIRAYGSVTDDLRFGSGAAGSEVDYLSIGNTGIFTWSNVGGVAGTAMTLNSTGLGVGASPQAKLHVSNGATIDSGLFTGLMIGASVAGSARSASIIKDTSTPYNLIIRTQDFTGGTTGSFIVRNGSTDQFQIDSSGNVGIGVTPSAGKGCLQLSSGINFPATQVASSDANTLDDYEEGTFTPTIVGTTGAGTGTYTTQLGRYTKVGRIVTCDISLVWTAHDGTGNIDIGGLPFSVLNTTGYAASAVIGYIDNIALTAGNIPIAVLWWFNTTKIRLNQTPTGGGAAAGVPMDSAGQINLSITYIVA